MQGLLKIPWPSGIVLALLLLASIPVYATIVRHVPLEEQAHSADAVVVAVAGNQSCSFGAGGGIIYTDTQFTVERWVKGQGGARVTSRQLGGVVGDIGQSVSGSPVFETELRYVLFLEARGDGLYRVVGFSQGAYPVVKAPGGGRRVMPRLASAAGMELVGVDRDGEMAPQPLEEFLATVRGYLGED